MGGMAISVRQPWASLIVCGLKNVELRTWATDYKGLLYIHAAKRLDEHAILRFMIEEPPRGCLIGTVELVEVEKLTIPRWNELASQHLDNGPYASGLYAWHLANPRQMTETIPYTGVRGLFPIAGADAAPPARQGTLFS